MKKTQDFTQGAIVLPLIRFALPVLGALFLQTMYGAVDLLVVGQYASAADVSAVSTGSQLMQTMTVLSSGLATLSSSLDQILLCLIYYLILWRAEKKH